MVVRYVGEGWTSGVPPQAAHASRLSSVLQGLRAGCEKLAISGLRGFWQGAFCATTCGCRCSCATAGYTPGVRMNARPGEKAPHLEEPRIVRGVATRPRRGNPDNKCIEGEKDNLWEAVWYRGCQPRPALPSEAANTCQGPAVQNVSSQNCQDAGQDHPNSDDARQSWPTPGPTPVDLELHRAKQRSTPSRAGSGHLSFSSAVGVACLRRL